ncbi:MAG: lipoprotein-releasing ABC transporter permease subunit [Alphaproteobacteria bacterium]|nr:MAG: lipoprotein-releasing ABC transporter permease subunit [Alphaproteobacteria bacterium]
MIQAVERLVAMRYLRARRQEGFISVIAWFSLLGIALGVATLIIVMAVMNGFRAELLGRILGLNGHISVAANAGQSIPDPDALAQRIRGLAGVVSASPMIEGQVMATANGVSSGALVRGMRAGDLHARQTIASAVKLGRIDAMGDDGLLIGLRMAQRMGVTVGDQITLISPRGNPTPFGTVPRLVSFQVAAVFEVGMFEYDNTYVYMPFQAAQAFFRVPDGATNIEVLLANADQAPFLSDAIWMLDPRTIRVLDWQRTNASFFNALQVERNVMFLILTLIILVAAFNIISSMIMLVKDKGRDIAILRTMGASRGTVMRIFFLAGFSVGAIGTLAGLCLGVAFATNIESIRQWLEGLTGTNLFAAEIYFLSRLPARLDWNEVIQVVLMALGLSVLATLYPSWRAARLDPVEALRYE